MTAPVVKVELGSGSTWKTLDADIVWEDVTPYVMESVDVTASRGRRSVQERFSTGTIGLTLKNEARYFDPSFSGSLFPSTSLYPSTTLFPGGGTPSPFKPGVPIRITTTPAGQSSRNVARGFVSGFPQRYDLGNTMAYVPISGYGIFDKLARAKLPQSAVDVEVLADSPVAYWKLDDVSEAEMLDSSGNDHHGVYDNPELGQDPLVADGGSSVFFSYHGDHRGKVNELLLPAFPFTFEAWVKFPRDLTQFKLFVAMIDNTSLSATTYLYCSNNGSPPFTNPSGALCMARSSSPPFLLRIIHGDTTIDDNLAHHCVGVFTDATTWSMYVDGVANSVTFDASDTPALPNCPLIGVGNNWDTKYGDWGLEGDIDNVAIYNTSLSAARIAAHYNAGASPYDGDTTDVRLNRVCGLIGLPSDRRSFQACTTILGPTVLGQQRALDYARLLEASEDGRMFETADGKIRLLDRYWGLTDTHATSSQQTFSDLTGVSYSDLAIDPDDELLVNICTGSRQGGPELTITNQDSVDTYGSADTSITTLLQTDAQTRSLAEHVVLVRGTPQNRVSKLRVPIHKYTAVQQAAILDLEIGYRITVDRTPQGVGDPISLDLIIEGIDHTINTFEHWIEFNVSVAPTEPIGLWGTGLWGSALWAW